MPKSKSKSKSEQAQVQGEVVTGHIELNGQGSKPSHKSVVKPGKFVNYGPAISFYLREFFQEYRSQGQENAEERSNSVVSPPKVYNYSSEKPGK
jgi:hypothetical protein